MQKKAKPKAKVEDKDHKTNSQEIDNNIIELKGNGKWQLRQTN